MRGILGFLFYSAIALAPIVVAVFAAGFSSRRDRLIAGLAGVIGFLVGGIVGWTSVPAEWTASFWTTIEATGNAAKYGESFEHMAEHALMYFFYSALLAEIAFGLAAFVVVRLIRGSASMRRPTPSA